MKQEAINKIEAKLLSLKFEVDKLQNELSMGLTAGITIEETKDLIDGLSKERKLFTYILEQIK
jgi:hypothetical protein